MRYNEQYIDITWENSTIRKWLNETFINRAFTAEQRSKIIKSCIENRDNAKWGTKGGNATRDKLFLLSIEEVEKYFKDDESRAAYPTPYAKSKKSVNGNLYVYVDDDHIRTNRGSSCWWWLRSPGDIQFNAANIFPYGKVCSLGNFVFDDRNAVRPAFKINLNSF